MGKTTVTTIDTTNDCAKVLMGAGGGTTPPGQIAWKSSSPKLNPSTLTLGPSTTNNGPPITVDTTSGSVSAGSFAGDTVATHSVISESAGFIAMKCSTHGLKALHINPSGSTFTLS
jgi:hypothetical protein